MELAAARMGAAPAERYQSTVPPECFARGSLNVALIGFREQIRMPRITGGACVAIKKIIHGVAKERIVHQVVLPAARLHYQAITLYAGGEGQETEDGVTAAGVSGCARRSGGSGGRAADVYPSNSVVPRRTVIDLIGGTTPDPYPIHGVVPGAQFTEIVILCPSQQEAGGVALVIEALRGHRARLTLQPVLPAADGRIRFLGPRGREENIRRTRQQMNTDAGSRASPSDAVAVG